MQKVALLKSMSRQYLSAKNTMRRHRKTLSMVKLFVVSCICFGVFAMYAVNVSASSTEWWKLKTVQRELKEKEFDYSIAKLDILKLEGKLFEEVNQSANYWYDRKESIVIVDAFDVAKVK